MSEIPFDPSEWITSAEAAALTGYHRDAFPKAARRGSLRSTKRGNMLFYLRADILAYIQQMQALGPQKHTPKAYRDETAH